MKSHLLRALALITACCALAAQAQSQSEGTSQDKPKDKPQNSSAQDYSPGATHSRDASGVAGDRSKYRTTGWTGQYQPLRASQLTSAQVTSSSGENLGTIKDVIINPASGRIDFAVLSVNSMTKPSTTASTTSDSTLGTLTRDGKQVVVPWMLLRNSPTATGAAPTTDPAKGAAGKMQFVFSGDATKLQSGPAFSEASDWSQPTYRQSIYSHYGLTSGAATGGSLSPGGQTTGSSRDDAEKQNQNPADPSSGSADRDQRDRPPGSTPR
jgi:sporulation protein YlmC with PRC-barrel domain